LNVKNRFLRHVIVKARANQVENQNRRLGGMGAKDADVHRPGGCFLLPVKVEWRHP
jgi:hypothetical protein